MSGASGTYERASLSLGIPVEAGATRLGAFAKGLSGAGPRAQQSKGLGTQPKVRVAASLHVGPRQFQLKYQRPSDVDLLVR